MESDPTNQNYQTRWSNSLAGKNKFGGWNDDGRARFVELCRAIKAAKRKEHVRDLEETILKEIQDKYSKVQAQAPEEEGEEADEERAKINELLADSKEIRGEEEDLDEDEAGNVVDLDDNFEPAKKKKKV